MDEFVVRQIRLVRDAIIGYRVGNIDLNDLVQRIEAVSGVIDVDAWKDRLFAAVLVLEQVNAASLNEKRCLSEEEVADVSSALSELDAHVGDIDAM